jgi:hypothetical protein
MQLFLDFILTRKNVNFNVAQKKTKKNGPTDFFKDYVWWTRKNLGGCRVLTT